MRIGKIPILKDLQKRIRVKRLNRFVDELEPASASKILDVGGTVPTWCFPQTKECSALLLNLGASSIPEGEEARLSSVAGDATQLTYEDASFDIAFSNSVIEHVWTWENQQKFASEIRRVGKAIWVQTPAQEFFFEPHYITPFIHWFPKKTRMKLVRWFTLWGLSAKPTKQKVEDRVNEIRLLKYAEMKELFPDCEIIREKFLGMTKSYIALRK